MTQTPGQPDSSTTQQQPQPGRVRPFDAMTIPAELPNSGGNGAVPTMPGALPELPAPRQGVPQSRATLPPPPPPLPHFHQQQQQSQRAASLFSNIRVGYPAMPGSLPIPPSQGTPQPDLHQQQQQQQPPLQQGSESRPVRWSVRFAPPPGPGYPHPPSPEHVRPRSVPSPFPQPVGTGAESTDEEPYVHVLVS